MNRVKNGGPLRLILGFLFVLLVGAGVMLFYPGGCNSAKRPTGPSSESTSNVILRLSGSNTIGSELAPALAQAFLREQGATDARILPGANDEEKSIVGTLPGNNSPVTIQVLAHGSATAFTALSGGSADTASRSSSASPTPSFRSPRTSSRRSFQARPRTGRE